jgi:hypothetical protein
VYELKQILKNKKQNTKKRKKKKREREIEKKRIMYLVYSKATLEY